MLRIILLSLILLIGAIAAFGQEPRLVDEFPRIPCGDFMGRMDALLAEWEKDPKQQITVIYYGQRYRKSTIFNKKGNPVATALDYPHRDDGLNWAKGVPRYLLARAEEIGPNRAPRLSGLGDKIGLVDGGYRESIGVEIWLAPPSAIPPKPRATISERDITFRNDKPYPVPNMISCYSQYN